MQTNRRSRMLVLGSSGLLGSNLSIALHKMPDIEPILVSRQKSPTTSHVVSKYDRENLIDLVRTLKPSVIVNCVGVVGHEKVENFPESARQANIGIPASLGEITSIHGIKLVHFSSDSVYSGNAKRAPFSETSETHPFSLYGHQKLESELAVLERHPESLVLRVNFFGWSRSGMKGMLDHFAYHAVRETQPIGYSRYTVNSLYTGDLAEVMLGAVDADLEGVFNLGSSNSLSKFDFGRALFAQSNRDVEQVIAGDPSFWAADGTIARNLSMSSQKIEKALGIKLASQEEGISRALRELADYLAFFRSGIDDPRGKLLANRSHP